MSETCPICPKHHNHDRSNFWTLNFKDNDGLYFCFRCGGSGTWGGFYKLMVGENISKENVGQREARGGNSEGVREGYQEHAEVEDFGEYGDQNGDPNGVKIETVGNEERSQDQFKRSHFESNSFQNLKGELVCYVLGI